MEEKKDTKPIGELVTLKPNVIGREHYFEYVNGTEVQCAKCPLGYGVTPETTVRDGHIYIEGILVI
jgi:hypothetical protein